MAGAYYNEHDGQKAATLRNLIEEGAIAAGVVDERSILEVQPEDLAGFTQHHFFAGGGLWSLCLRLAGWPDDRPVWTGSCPCGPFSKAGLRKGFDDPRHLWPQWLRLISVRRPDVLFGEQSDEADSWLDLVSADLESRGYAVGSAVIPAAGFGGFHGRHRIGFVADANDAQRWTERAPWHDGRWPKAGRVKGDHHARDDRADGGLAHAYASGQPQQPEHDGSGAFSSVQLDAWFGALRRGHSVGMGHASGHRSAADGRDHGQVRSLQEAQRQPEQRAPLSRGPSAPVGLVHTAECGWRVGGEGYGHVFIPDGSGVIEWVACRDGRWRPVEPGLSPLADAHPGRLAQLRLYGDAIDVEAFTNFIGAYLDAAAHLSSQSRAA